jgi:glycerol-3-phosphate acyltransferase PlsY
MIESHPVLVALGLLAIGYVIGATPFGWLIARLRGVDIRQVGSGNVGATNVGRALGRKWGYLCFFLDAAKGLAPVLLVGLWVRPAEGPIDPWAQLAWLAVGCGTILGHVLTFWLGFRGGKGVATSLGVVLGIWPYFTWPGLIALGLWVVVVVTSRYVSVASILAAASFWPVFALFNRRHLGELWPMSLFAGAMILLIILRHRSNITRLVRGQEHRIGQPRHTGPEDAAG